MVYWDFMMFDGIRIINYDLQIMVFHGCDRPNMNGEWDVYCIGGIFDGSSMVTG